MNTRDKAGVLLCKLYGMCKRELAFISVEDILDNATEEEIDYYMIIGRIQELRC